MSNSRNLFAMLALALAACTAEPVENIVAPAADQLGDASAEGLAAPANSSAAEAQQSAATPLGTDGMRWSSSASGGTASFGPAGGDAQLTIDCSDGTLVITRNASAAKASGTLSFTGNGRAASLPLQAAADATHWSASFIPGDTTNAVARLFDGTGAVEITLGGTPDLVTPPSDAPARAFAACG